MEVQDLRMRSSLTYFLDKHTFQWSKGRYEQVYYFPKGHRKKQRNRQKTEKVNEKKNGTRRKINKTLGISKHLSMLTEYSFSWMALLQIKLSATIYTIIGYEN